MTVAVSLPTIPGTAEADAQASSDTSSDWDSLADAENDSTATPYAPADDAPSTDNTHVIAPPKGHCHTCGEFIERPPGARGRAPKYHPECRPSKSSGTVTRRDARMSKLEQQIEAEADAAVEGIRKVLVKAALMLSMVDTYDAFCVMVYIPEICANLRGLLLRYDWLRREFLAIGTGGSILGLVFSVGMMVLPMLAHHGIISSKRIGTILLNSPFVMKKIAERMEDGEESLTNLMAETVKAQAAHKREAEKNRATVDEPSK